MFKINSIQIKSLFKKLKSILILKIRLLFNIKTKNEKFPECILYSLSNSF